MAENYFGGTNQTQAPGYVQDALNKPLTFANTTAALNPGQIQQQAADTAYQSATRYLDPQFQRQQAGLENQLANQGITRGSEAWNNAMNQFGENKNQAYDQARSQAYTQGLSGANQALNTMFQQGTLDVARENAAKMADAMKTQGMYGLGAGFLGSPTGSKIAGSALDTLGSFGSSALKGLGGLFGGGGSLNSLVGGSDIADLIGLGGSSSAGPSVLGKLGGLFGGGNSYGMDADLAAQLGLSGGESAGLSGFDPTGGYLTAALTADKLTGGKLGVGKTVNDLVGGATNAISDLGSSIGDVFGW